MRGPPPKQNRTTNMNNNFELRLNDQDAVTGGERVALAVLLVAAAMGALV
jgi:hypothetical protein